MFDVGDLNVFYGDFHAVFDVTLDIRQREITALIGPSGCGKSTVLRCFNRMNDLIEGARVSGAIEYHGVDLYGPEIDPVEVRRHIGHGVPEAEPVPQVDLRQHRLRPQDHRLQGQHGRPRRGIAATGRALGRGQGQAQRVGLRPVGWPAAAAVHRPGHRHEPRRRC